MDCDAPCRDIALGTITPCVIRWRGQRCALLSETDVIFGLSWSSNTKHSYLNTWDLQARGTAALLSIPQHQRIKGGHVVSASSKPSQQLVTALWPECSGASTPRQCGFSPHSGDNGLSRAAWLAVHRVICRMSASAESRPVLAGWRGRGVSFR